MSDANQRNFEVRMNRINRRQQRLSRGYVMSVNHDGLIIAEPKARSSVIPWRGILFVLVGTLIVKGVMLAQIGPEAYDARVATLASGQPGREDRRLRSFCRSGHAMDRGQGRPALARGVIPRGVRMGTGKGRSLGTRPFRFNAGHSGRRSRFRPG